MKQLKHWQDYANAVLGVWLVVSPLALGFRGELVAMGNFMLVGVLLVAISLGAIFVPHAWEEWTETLLGFWLAISPWVLGFNSQPAMATSLVSGLVILTLGLWALQDFESGSARTTPT